MEHQQPHQEGGAGVEALTGEGSFEHNRVETIISIEEMNSSHGIIETQMHESVGENKMNIPKHPQLSSSPLRPQTRSTFESAMRMALPKGQGQNSVQGSPKLASVMEHQQQSQEGEAGVVASTHQGSFEPIAKEVTDSWHKFMESQKFSSSNPQPITESIESTMEFVLDEGPNDHQNLVPGSSNNETMTGLAKSPRVLASVQDHANNNKNQDLPKAAYLSIKGDDVSSWENLDELFHYKSPTGNTVLHVASRYGKDKWVERIIAKRDSNILTAKNDNGDTPLHVAARDGRVSTLKILLTANLLRNLPIDYEDPVEALGEVLARNKQGDTFFHVALFNKDESVINFLLSDEASGSNCIGGLVERAALFWDNNEEKSVLYLAIEAGYKEVVDKIMVKLINQPPALNNLIEEYPELAQLIPHGPDYVPAGKSPLLAAIIKRDKDILHTILKQKPEWIHSRDLKGMIPLHYAAFVGYLQGVQYLLEKCPSCADERDEYGFLPLHLASSEGHVKVVKKLLEFCPYPREILDRKGRNILHIAAQSGKFKMVKYILRIIDHEFEREMINDKDVNGNTPLHLATICCHPKVVHALTWDKRVNFTLVNANNQTPFDACGRNPLSFRQVLTWIALKSAGVPSVDTLSCSIKVSPNSVQSMKPKQNDPDMGQFKDGIDTLIVVSTLIITAAFAAGFIIPSSGDSSHSLNSVWFKIFIFCTTISMYGSVGVTLILIWARQENIYLALPAIKAAKPLLGVTIATLSVAFLAGVHLIINDLSWLATTVLAMSATFTLMLLLLYVHLWLPSSSRNKLVRYISYYPFLMVASLVEHD